LQAIDKQVLRFAQDDKCVGAEVGTRTRELETILRLETISRLETSLKLETSSNTERASA
jgi:hypothetical protein